MGAEDSQLCFAVAPERWATLRTRGLTKTYRTGEVEVAAMRGVDLALYEGAQVVLLGASGRRPDLGRGLVRRGAALQVRQSRGRAPKRPT